MATNGRSDGQMPCPSSKPGIVPGVDPGRFCQFSPPRQGVLKRRTATGHLSCAHDLEPQDVGLVLFNGMFSLFKSVDIWLILMGAEPSFGFQNGF